MKVAYNGCYGGFSLSPKALTEFARLKGVNLTWYKQTGYRHQGNEEYIKVSGCVEESFDLTASSKDLGDKITSVPNESFYWPNFDDLRSDSDLIYVIEQMGDEANGLCSNLKIADIPDGADYEITYYDGMESVVPPRSSW